MLEESSFSIIDFSGALARLTGGESGEPYGLLLRVALRCAWGAVGAVIAAFLLHKKMKPKDFFFFMPSAILMSLIFAPSNASASHFRPLAASGPQPQFPWFRPQASWLRRTASARRVVTTIFQAWNTIGITRGFLTLTTARRSEGGTRFTRRFARPAIVWIRFT